MLVWTVGQDLEDFGFRSRGENLKSGADEGECGDDVAGLLVTERSLDILPVKKEAKLPASEVPG